MKENNDAPELTTAEILRRLEQMKLDILSSTPQFSCFGCGHEHNCSLHGCKVILGAIELIRASQPGV